MRIVVAPDSFKNAISATAAARAIAAGVRRARPDADVIELPMADGGEGTLDVLVNARDGLRRSVSATGPLGNPLDAPVGLLREASTAIVELATVAGYHLVPTELRDPLKTSTYGVGRVLRTVIESEIEEIILALGGSATVDGGAGMMQALGATFFDNAGRVIPAAIAGGHLLQISRFIWDKPPAGIEHVQFTIACDVLNPACGPDGAAAVFGPQKGADTDGVRRLDAGLSHWADLLEQASGRSIRNEPGAGAAGGVALPLLALTSAALVPGVDLVAEACDLASHVGGADLVITGEGCLDRQSLMGKVVGAVARTARSAGVPCIALVGKTGSGVEDCLRILNRCETLDAPLASTETRLTELAEHIAGDFHAS
ncbi:MAG: glycerate kinase [Planctomycetota bacterium]